MSDAITSTKPEPTRHFGTADALCVHGYLRFEPGHESEMRGYLVYVLIVKKLSNRFCLNSATAY